MRSISSYDGRGPVQPAVHPEFLATLRNPQLTAREVMSAPVVRITETTEAPEIARLLEEYRIKRVPVVRDDRIVGIVSRADLLRAFQRSTRRSTARGTPPNGRGWAARSFVRSIPALVTTT